MTLSKINKQKADKLQNFMENEIQIGKRLYDVFKELHLLSGNPMAKFLPKWDDTSEATKMIWFAIGCKGLSVIIDHHEKINEILRTNLEDIKVDGPVQ